MRTLRHAFVIRTPKSKIRAHIDDRVAVEGQCDKHSECGEIYLQHTFKVGKGLSVLSIYVGSKDFSLLLAQMMKADRTATVQAIGSTLSGFRQEDDE